MVGNSLHLLPGNLGGANVHVLIHLHGVCRDHLPSQNPGKGDGKLCLSHRRWAGENNHGIFHLTPAVQEFFPRAAHFTTLPVYVTIRLNFLSMSALVIATMVGLPWGQL